MGKHTFVYLFWLCSLFVLISCKDDEMVVLPSGPFNSLGVCDEDVGAFNLLDSSLSFLPYQSGNSEVVFQNEAGERESFSIVEKTSRNIDGIFYDYSVYEDGDTISYCYTIQRKQYIISCDDLDLEFEINIEVRPYYPELKEALLADIVNIFYTNKQTSPALYTMIFRKNIDSRNYPSQLYANNIMKADRTFLNADFKNVEYTAFNNPSLKLFFNKKEGIVAFENDLFGLWRFVEIR